jgi:hypothetical protein
VGAARAGGHISKSAGFLYRCGDAASRSHLNARPVSLNVATEDTPLLAVLRNNLDLMGARFGCGAAWSRRDAERIRDRIVRKLLAG